MKIFSAEQIRAWDKFTIENEPVTSIDLMERAAEKCTQWLAKNFNKNDSFFIFCGPGNNGGDGLAIARLLKQKNYAVKVFIAGNKKGSRDFETNKERWEKEGEVNYIVTNQDFPQPGESVVIEALFGSGLNRPPEGIFKKLIQYLNESAQTIVSIDVPGGMFLDTTSKDSTVIKSDHVLSFQNNKLAFLMSENSPYLGKVTLLDIRLSPNFEDKEKAGFEQTDTAMMREIFRPRAPFTNKGDYGNACLIAGSYGMMGAAILCSRACLRSGVGKLTCYVPEKGYEIMQISVPEAMTKVFGIKHIEEVEGLSAFNMIGIGPGIGKHSSHFKLLKTVFNDFKKPLVIDADALNMIAEFPDLLQHVPEESVLTPHPREFERVFGKTGSDFETIDLALKNARHHKINIILKGHRTFIATSAGKGYFNSTGNAGMATAGAGDVLTGIVSGLIAQKYSPQDACLLGSYLHGLAGDYAAEKIGEEAMTAGDIVNYLPNAFLALKQE